MEVSKARQVARLTHTLGAQAAGWVDEQIGATVAQKSWKAIEQTVAMAIHLFHPELAEELARRGKAGWHVTAQHPDYVDFAGTSHLDASADSMDLEDFMAAVNQVAAQLGQDGDTDTVDQRKAKALGILGRLATGRPEHPTADDPTAEFLADAAAPLDPDAPADGLFGDPFDPHPEPDEADDAAGETADADDEGGVGEADVKSDAAAADADADPVTSTSEHAKSRAAKPKATKVGSAPRPGGGRPTRIRSRRPIVVRAYISDQAVTGATTGANPDTATGFPSAGGAPTTLYEVPGYGIVAESVFVYWCTTHDLRASRVIDLTRATAVDAHDPPEWMRDVVKERDRHCVFPHCAVDAELCDLDHIDPYDPHGPPGQTSPEKLACLCRQHHLLKTHAGWTYTRASDGTYAWRSPHHRHYLRGADGITHTTGDAA